MGFFMLKNNKLAKIMSKICTPGDLLIFIQFVNSFHHSIKFTYEFSFMTRSVVFLDLVIWVEDQGFIQTDLHAKDNAKNSYLLPLSNHPGHITTNIPYSLAFRIKRNCSQEERCIARFKELKVKLLESRIVDNAQCVEQGEYSPEGG